MNHLKYLMKYYYENPKLLILNLLSRMRILRWLNDEQCIRLLWKCHLNTSLNLQAPQTFNEKLQWLKLHDRNPLYTTLVDKYAVKKWVAQKVGEQYIIPTLGMWNSFEEIDFDKLPNQFVLKTTHDSGGLVICRDKMAFDKQKARIKLDRSLKRNYYYSGREWPYKDVPPRIIAEQFLSDNIHKDLTDYKFYCFNGIPQFLYVSTGLENHATARISFLTLDWEFAPFGRQDFDSFTVLPPKPKNFGHMLKLCRQLAQTLPFVRVDLYEVGEKIYFSELTFHPCNGFMPFTPSQWDKKIGDMLRLPTQ